MTYDVIIAGAGIIGSSVAWRLSQAGLRVALFDAGRAGAEASWAAAGMLAPGGEIEAPSAESDFLLESLRAYPDFVAQLAAETGTDIDFQRFGAIEVAASAGEFAELKLRATRQAALGIPSCPMTAEEACRQVPLLNPEIAGAFFYPEDALVNPREITRALVTALRNRGATIHEGVAVSGIRPEQGGVAVATANGEFSSGAAVLAAGAWSSTIPVAGSELPRSFPVRGHLLGFHLERDTPRPILRRGQTYLVQRASGFTIAGASTEHCGFDSTLDSAIIDDIRSRAGWILPALENRTPDESWVGFRPAVDSPEPVIRRVGDAPLWLAYGHYRNGILMAPLTAARVAESIISNSEMGSFGQTGRR